MCEEESRGRTLFFIRPSANRPAVFILGLSQGDSIAFPSFSGDGAKKIATELGSPELLVNNASVTQLIPLGDFEAVTDEVRDTILAVNVLGMFYYARVLAPYVKARGRDAIVNVGSIAGLTGNGSSPPHAVSKAAVAGLTKSLAHALAPEIRVCCVAPRIVATRWWKGREEEMEHLRREALLRRTTTPEEVAELICTLLEQEAITGQTFVIDSVQTV